MERNRGEIWVFGDYRNYFENRVTLQLLAKGRQLGAELGAELCAVLLGSGLDEYVWEYGCHGADRVYVCDDPKLAGYGVERYSALLARLARERAPQILLIGATTFGRDLAPRVAKLLGTGLSADCVDLRIDEQGRLVQTAPFFGGNLLADIVTPRARPQMATVRPGVFRELAHNDELAAERVAVPLPEDLPPERVRLLDSRKQEKQAEELEAARIVVCGGRGVGSKKKFRNLHELAALLGAQVGATRPVVYADWIDHAALVGQAGKSVKPQVLFSFGVSGAIQHAAALSGAEFIIAVNKNPNAPMMKLADVAVVADANQLCLALIRELKNRLDRP